MDLEVGYRVTAVQGGDGWEVCWCYVENYVGEERGCRVGDVGEGVGVGSEYDSLVF